MKKVIIGSRGSVLALTQTEIIKRELEKHFSEVEFEVKIIITTGDKDLISNWNNSDKSLKSFFTKEIESALLNGEIDLAVHSMKDMPIISPNGLICGAIPDREDERDVLISRDGKKFLELQKNAVIGTSSLRRTMNLKRVREDIKIKQLRGNIHTRLNKLKAGEYDAIILAAAGLKRANLENEITEYLDPTKFLPAPAQGVLYIQCRENDEYIKNILKSIHNENVEKIVKIEREFSKIFDGGCHTPMGCYSKVNGNLITFTGIYFRGEKGYLDSVTENIDDGIKIAQKLAELIKGKIDE